MNNDIKENERIDDLQINGLKIIQNKDKFCFGIDSVLLADFAKNMKKNANILDLGTGTGILAILLTAKVHVNKIIGIEIQEEMAEMARRSIELNNLENKITILNQDIRHMDEILETYKYDVIITNPPYMKKNTGLKNEDESKLISRHEVECTLDDIARISTKLLKDNGEIYMVHRPDRLVDIMEKFRKFRLEIKEMRVVYSKFGTQANLILIKAVKNGRPFLKIHNPLYVYNEYGKYTDEILKIYNKK